MCHCCWIHVLEKEHVYGFHFKKANTSFMYLWQFFTDFKSGKTIGRLGAMHYTFRICGVRTNTEWRKTQKNTRSLGLKGTEVLGSRLMTHGDYRVYLFSRLAVRGGRQVDKRERDLVAAALLISDYLMDQGLRRNEVAARVTVWVIAQQQMRHRRALLGTRAIRSSPTSALTQATSIQ